MSDAKETDLESVSGEALDTDPAPTRGGRQPYDADGFVEPDRLDPAADDEIDDPSLDEADGPLTEP